MFFSKAIESISKNIAKALHKEQRGIYNVTYNGKFSTPNLGQSLREYLPKHKEPFIDKDGSRIYEWAENGVNFRVVSGDNSASGKGANSLITSTTSAEDIITFYSDRNLANDKKFEFKNPKIREPNKLESTNLINDKLPPMMRE